MTKKCVSAELLYEFRPISGCNIAPDGKRVVFSVQRVERKSEAKYSNLWMAETGRANSAEQYTFGDHNDHSPVWSPDGRWIAFLSNRGDQTKPAQIYLIPTHGGEARPLTYIEGQISDLSWSPDGGRLLCAVCKTDPIAVDRRDDPAKQKLGVVERHITRIHYKYDGVGFLPDERWHIWTIDVKRKKATQLTDGVICHEHAPIWSPDGKQIAFLSNRAADPDFNPGGDAIYLIAADGKLSAETDFVEIDTPFGSKSHLSWSPDGSQIAYFATLGRGDWWQHTHLWTVASDGSTAARNLTGAHDRDFGNVGMNDLGGCETATAVWSADCSQLFCQMTHHGNVTLQRVEVATGQLAPVVAEDGVVGAFSLAGEQLAYWHTTMMRSGEIFTRKLGENRPKQLSRINERVFGRKNLGQVEEVWFDGADGNRLQGWILTPPDFDRSQQYPSIMEMHGGPLAQYSNAFMHEFFYLAAQGYVVYFCNPRGGRGYGDAHAKAIWNDHGGVDVDDVLTWANYVAQLPYIDVERRGITGGSYGGFLVNWLIGHTDQFAAAVTQRSISNRTSSYGSSDINWLREITFDDEPPWENLDNYWRQSPLKYIANAKTPTLVIHSELDLRCPMEQGEQIYVALKRLGVDTEMVRYPDESHGLSRIGRTDRRIRRLEHISRWFDRYLKANTVSILTNQ